MLKGTPTNLNRRAPVHNSSKPNVKSYMIGNPTKRYNISTRGNSIQQQYQQVQGEMDLQFKL
jgi:hypothetical protein